MVKADKFASFHLPEKCPENSLTYSYMWAGTAAKDGHEILAVLCCATYPEGDTAVAFGSLQEDPTLVFLSPLVLGRKQRKKKVTKH